MRTAREVIAESRCKRAQDIWGSGVTMNPGDWLEGADVDIAALRAEGLVIVAAADVEWLIAFVARDFQRDGYPVCGEAVGVTNRINAALAAGGE